MCCCALISTPAVSAVSWDAFTPEELGEPEEGVRREDAEIQGCLCVALGSALSEEGEEELWCLLAPRSRGRCV